MGPQLHEFVAKEAISSLQGTQKTFFRSQAPSKEQSLHLPVVKHKDNCEHLWKYGTSKPLVPVLYSRVIVLNPEKVDSSVKMTLVLYN